MTDPVEHPLISMLGPDWRTLHDPAREEVVLLHVEGLWTFFRIEDLWGGMLTRSSVWVWLQTWHEIACALREAVESGEVGRHVAEGTDHYEDDQIVAVSITFVEW